MAILSIIVAILLLKKGGKGSKYSVATLQHTIALNNRYAGFLKNGFSPKEAYVYTLEWSDRQASIEALDNVASMVGVVAMSNLIRPNK